MFKPLKHRYLLGEQHLLPTACPQHMALQAFGQMPYFTSGKIGEPLDLHSAIHS